MSKARFLNRRNFLTGAAGVAVGLPLLESIGAGPLHAQEGEITKRFLSYHCSCGVDWHNFWPELGALTADSFTGTGMAPLAPFADRLLIPRGVHGYPIGTWTGHGQATSQALSAGEWVDNKSASTSIDHIIARALNPEGREALVLKPGFAAYNAWLRTISYSAPGQMVEPELNPYVAYRSIMGLGPSGLGDSGDGPDEATERLFKRRQSVVDFACEELEELRRIDLSAADKKKLDQHFSLIRDVETGMTTDAGIVACVLDASTEAELEAINGDTVEDNANFPAMLRYMQQIAVLSLACQYTRSTVLMVGGSSESAPMYQWDGIFHTLKHHPISHGEVSDGGEKIDGYLGMLHEIDLWLTGEFANVLSMMDAYDEGDGRSLLDNTVVFYSNEFSDGAGHTTGDLPLMIAGGADYFRTGESILLPGAEANRAGVSGKNGSAHRMLCTILNAMGIPTADWNGGTEIAEFKA